jgi:hypothetical protein
MVNQISINVESVPAKIPRIAVYLSSEAIKTELEMLAASERRSVSQMAAILIEEGLLKAKQEGKFSSAREQASKKE